MVEILKTLPIKGIEGVVHIVRHKGKRWVMKVAQQKRFSSTITYERSILGYLNEKLNQLCLDNFFPRIDTDFKTYKGEPAIMMEYIKGGVNLADVILKMSDEERASVLQRIQTAITCLCSVGVIHGDLHMGNIMYIPSNRSIRIIDYGTVSKVSTTSIMRDTLSCPDTFRKFYKKHWKDVQKQVRNREGAAGVGNPNSRWMGNKSISFGAGSFVNDILKKSRSKTTKSLIDIDEQTDVELAKTLGKFTKAMKGILKDQDGASKLIEKQGIEFEKLKQKQMLYGKTTLPPN